MASVPGDEGDAVILLGDTPLLRAATIAELVNTHRASGAALTVVGAEVADPTGYGRLVVRDGVLEAIVEEADASPEQRLITLINTGLMIARVAPLRRALAGLGNDNVKGEFYLTDIVGLVRHADEPTAVYELSDPNEAAGVNTPDQLAVADRAMRERLASR
jgi:bifunctional UDP-N-acetylglucosamine pyrophosphorylase/glucosamine-1-phosphate N-acetyltransferase